MSTEPVRRSTKQRSAVRSCLTESAEFQTAQQVHERLRNAGESIGLATVYRALSALAADGEVDQLQNADGETAYRYCSSRQHHHHLICRQCATTVELSAAQMEAWIAAISAEHGFTQVDHQFELFGLCDQCRRSAEH